MDDNKLVALIGTLGVRVDLVGDTVSGPASVRDTAMGLVNSVEVQKSFHCWLRTGCVKRESMMTVNLIFHLEYAKTTV